MGLRARVVRHAAHLEWACAGLALAYVLWQAVLSLQAAWPFTTDDAYITLRYARHLAAGHGVVWNVGEVPPVEGYSNFLYVLMGAASLYVGADPVWVFKSLGAVTCLGSVLLLWWLARQWVGPLLAVAPGYVLTLQHGQIMWAVSGLETPTFQFLLLLAMVAFFRALGFRALALDAPEDVRALRRSGGSVAGPWLLATGVALTLLAMTRPEGALVAVVFGVALLRTAGFARRPWLYAGLSVLLPLTLYHLWRVVYFSAWLPHSVVCKSANFDARHVLVREYWQVAWLFVLLALLRPWRAVDLRTALLWGVPLLYFVMLLGVDPMIGHWHRHVLAPLALLLVSAVVGLTQVVKLMWAPPQRWIRDTLAGILVLLFAWQSLDGHGRHWLAADAQHYARRMAARADLGAFIAPRASGDDALLIGDCGLVPYVVDAPVIDAFCLNSLAMSQPPIGHDSGRFVAWVMAVAPRYVAVHSRTKAALVPRPEYGIFPRLVAHPDFGQRYGHVATFGADGDDFAYWLFERRE